jgi:molecular chaperone HtpG
MSRDELVDNLGTIAKSGTKAFVEQANAGDLRLIGQFGIGFYSAFMVASRVDVFSRHAGAAEAYKWSSDGTGTFTVEQATGSEAPARGTRIVLHLKEEATEFLEDFKIESVVRAYSDHIAHPIMLALGHETARQINTANAIWMRPKSEVTPDQYKEFFGHIAGIYSDPALTIHYTAEGRHEYRVLLFVPAEKPFDLYDPERRGRQRLYVRRVFITDDAELLPPYLRFVRGIIDSEDMPLNISREMLQNNPQVAQIRKAVTGRVLAELKKCAQNDQATFEKIWQAFGAVIKEGLYEDMERRDELYEIVRFATTKGAFVPLKDYVSRLKTNQTAIYYLTADDAAKAAASPQLEGFKARDIEVLLLSDPIDAFWVRTSLGYDGKPFKSATQGEADLERIPLADGAAKAEGDRAATGTLAAVMKQALGEAVKDVRLSARLTDSPVCLVADNTALDRTLERLLARQSGSGVKASAPILEINPSHPVIISLAHTAKTKGVTPELSDAAHLLLDVAWALDGEPIGDAGAFTRRLGQIMQKVFAPGV